MNVNIAVPHHAFVAKVAAMALGLVALAGGRAQAESLRYRIAFEGRPPIPSDGSFTWDTDRQRFTEFSASWEGVKIDMLKSANGPVTQSHGKATHHFRAADLYKAITTGWTLPNGRLLERKWDVYPPNPPGNKLVSSLSLRMFADNEGTGCGGNHPDPNYVVKHNQGSFKVYAEGSDEPIEPRRNKNVVDTRDQSGWLKYRLAFEGAPDAPTQGFFAWDPVQKRFMDFRIRWRDVTIDLLSSSNSPVSSMRSSAPPEEGERPRISLRFDREMFFKALTEGYSLPDGEVFKQTWSLNPPNPPGNKPYSSLSLKLHANPHGVGIGGQHPDPNIVVERRSGSFTVHPAGPTEEFEEPKAVADERPDNDPPEETRKDQPFVVD